MGYSHIAENSHNQVFNIAVIISSLWLDEKPQNIKFSGFKVLA